MAPTVVVTGASGFVAGEVIKALLEKGYNVRGTVRSTKSKEKIAHLEALGEALPGTLTLHEADLLTAGSFDEAIEGADYVFHTASPFAFKVDDPQKDLIDPAVEGTKNVLKTAGKHKSTVKQVVLTSSFQSIVKVDSGPSKPPRFTEEDWNTDSTIETDAYSLSKKLAEEAAWEVAKSEGLEMTTINPNLVLGPILSARTDATSIKYLTGLLEGKSNSILEWLCDVRDVARAHVRAIEVPAAKGQRFMIGQADTVPVSSTIKLLKEAYPEYKIQDAKEEGKPKPLLDNTKVLKVLGLGKLHDWEESILDMARTLIEKGVAKPQTK